MEHYESFLINQYIDGLLTPEKNMEFEDHVKNCMECFEIITWLNILLEKASSLPSKINPPNNLWKDIHRELRDIRIRENNIIEEETNVQNFGDLKIKNVKPEPAEVKEKKEISIPHKIKVKGENKFTSTKIFAFGISIIILSAAIFFMLNKDSWETYNLKGKPIINYTEAENKTNFSKGDILKTNLSSSIDLKNDQIGTIQVGANSYLKMTGNFQFELLSGSIKVREINAGELLEIKIPSAKIRDFNLSSAYDLKVNFEENSLLTVDDGWVRITDSNRESIVPPLHHCEVRKGVGPGIPYSFSAGSEIINALNTFSFSGDASVVPRILSVSRKEDAVSLWHLLQKVDDEEKENVFTILSRFVKPPVKIKNEEILKINREILLEWLEKIEITNESQI